MKRPCLRVCVLAVLGMALVLAGMGCDNRAPVISGTPTPSPSPTPAPQTFTASITGTPAPADALGKAIEEPDHYDHYLSLGDLRVYEYGEATFLDGVIVNGYPEPLDGEIEMVYYTAEGKLCGRGKLRNAAGGTVLKSGSNAIYAEISTDIDVQMLDAQYLIVTHFAPVAGE